MATTNIKIFGKQHSEEALSVKEKTGRYLRRSCLEVWLIEQARALQLVGVVTVSNKFL